MAFIGSENVSHGHPTLAHTHRSQKLLASAARTHHPLNIHPIRSEFYTIDKKKKYQLVIVEMGAGFGFDGVEALLREEERSGHIIVS